MIADRPAELQGGKAFAASAGPGQGSTFTVTLPAIEPQAGRPADRKPKERRRHRIVLIEDNEDARRTLAAALTLDGHQVHEAADGISGIAALARVNPDVAVVDIGLPGVDGYKVAETLRGAPEHDSMVLIALTGYGQPDDRRRALEAGFDAHLVKPVDFETLDEAIRAPRAEP